jgi:LacI family transcriptional regulator
MRSVNQQQIADKLKLSRATVSRSLANHHSISEATRAKVQRAAASLGYRGKPDIILRRGRQSRQITLGVLIGVPAQDVAMATFPFILQGIWERARAERMSVDVCYENPASFDASAKKQKLLRNIPEGEWRGAILIYPFTEVAVATLAKRMPAVAVLECYKAPGVDTIDTDDSSGVLLLVQHLKAQGHRRIGFLTWGYPVGGHWSVKRFGGYAEALLSSGLEFRPEWALNIHRSGTYLSSDEISERVISLLARDRVTAWVCAADHQAYRLVKDLNARGIRVPQECSVTGFDGLPPPLGMPAVTSIQVPHGDIGASAVTRLLGRIVDPNSVRRKILVEGRLVLGETTAAPRQ